MTELMEWIQPTPTPFVLAEPVHLVEITSSEEDPEEDPEEEEPEVQQPQPDEGMMPAPEEEVLPVIDLDSEEEIELEAATVSASESGLGWLVENDESSSHASRLEWMAPAYNHLYPCTPAVPPPPPADETTSSQSSSEFAVVPDLDRPGTSRVARAVTSLDSDSSRDPDGPSSRSSQMV